MTRSSDLDALDAYFHAMPPSAALGLRADRFDGECLRLSAPLSANVNDKDCAFGGSIAGVMTLAGWGLVMLKLKRLGIAAEVYVADSRIRYLAPLYDDLVAESRLPDAGAWASAVTCYGLHHRARISLDATMLDARGATVATLHARYAILPVTNHAARS
jgi:thioesterase domain-containing protein